MPVSKEPHYVWHYTCGVFPSTRSSDVTSKQIMFQVDLEEPRLFLLANLSHRHAGHVTPALQGISPPIWSDGNVKISCTVCLTDTLFAKNTVSWSLWEL